jgi:hypothetical protein
MISADDPVGISAVVRPIDEHEAAIGPLHTAQLMACSNADAPAAPASDTPANGPAGEGNGSPTGGDATTPATPDAARAPTPDAPAKADGTKRRASPNDPLPADKPESMTAVPHGHARKGETLAYDNKGNAYDISDPKTPLFAGKYDPYTNQLNRPMDDPGGPTQGAPEIAKRPSRPGDPTPTVPVDQFIPLPGIAGRPGEKLARDPNTSGVYDISDPSKPRFVGGYDPGVNKLHRYDDPNSEVTPVPSVPVKDMIPVHSSDQRPKEKLAKDSFGSVFDVSDPNNPKYVGKTQPGAVAGDEFVKRPPKLHSLPGDPTPAETPEQMKNYADSDRFKVDSNGNVFDMYRNRPVFVGKVGPDGYLTYGD